MRLLVIVLDDVVPDRLLENERLANLRQLMSAGCYGLLAPAAGIDSFEEDVICECIAQAGGQVMRADRPREALQQQAARACSLLADDAWDYLRVVLGLHLQGSAWDEAAEAQALASDEAVGQVLESLDDQTAVLLLAGLPVAGGAADEREPARGAFVFAAPGYPALGELHGVAWSDLAPTVLDAAGYDLPSSLAGRSLIAGLEPSREAQDLSMDEEALLRARLMGLGYIG